MGKYAAELPSKNPEKDVEKVELYLHRQGFQQTGRPGKEVWRRAAKTRLLSPEYVTVSAGEDVVQLEAWIKAVTPLPNLWVGNTDPMKGAPVGGSSKQRLRNRITQIQRIVAGERPTRR